VVKQKIIGEKGFRGSNGGKSPGIRIEYETEGGPRSREGVRF